MLSTRTSLLIETLLDLCELALPIPIIIIWRGSYGDGYCSDDDDWKRYAGVYLMCFFVILVASVSMVCTLAVFMIRLLCKCSRPNRMTAFKIFLLFFDVAFTSIWAALATSMHRHLSNTDTPTGLELRSFGPEFRTIKALSFATMGVFLLDALFSVFKDAFCDSV